MKAILFILLHCLPMLASAQMEQQQAISIGYYGDFFSHPGLTVKHELPLQYKLKIKEQRGSTQQRHRFKLLRSSITIYYHGGNHIGLMSLPEYVLRRIKENGKKREFAVGFGYHRSFLDAKTYRLNEAGQFERLKGAGQNSWITSFSYAFGKDYRLQAAKPWAWDISFGIMARGPYNSSVLLGLYGGLHLTYFFN